MKDKNSHADVERSLCEFALVSPAEVEKLLKGLLKGLNPSKASGPDNISSAELKLSAKCIARRNKKKYFC